MPALNEQAAGIRVNAHGTHIRTRTSASTAVHHRPSCLATLLRTYFAEATSAPAIGRRARRASRHRSAVLCFGSRRQQKSQQTVSPVCLGLSVPQEHPCEHCREDMANRAAGEVLRKESRLPHLRHARPFDDTCDHALVYHASPTQAFRSPKSGCGSPWLSTRPEMREPKHR